MSQKIGTYLIIIAAVVGAGQWIAIHLMANPAPSLVTAILAGLGIFSAAYLLTWAAELAQFDIPRTIAIILVALLAVLPEYAVDIYFAWKAAHDPVYISYAAANMTGGNRLLIGLGWASVAIAYWFRCKSPLIEIGKTHRLELKMLLFATIYSFVIPLFRKITIIDAIVFFVIFIFYMRGALREEVVEPELMAGPATTLAKLRPFARRCVVVLLFVLAGSSIYFAAEPFAESLLAVGEKFGIEKFILVQWIAPLASEAPEFLVAIIFAWNLKPSVGLSALISSKVNQWTLLIGMLPIVYSISAGHLMPLPLDARQNEELFLTAAQSLFALVLVADLKFSITDALLLAIPFLAQLSFPSTEVRMGFAFGYIGLSALLIILRPSLRQGFLALMPFCKSTNRN